MNTRDDQPVLEVESLSVAYRGTPPVMAVREVSLSLQRGRSLGLVGESGCGKTTLGAALLGLLPDAGRVVGGSMRFKGQPLPAPGAPAWSALRWTGLAAIFQNAMTALDPVRRVGDQITAAITLHRRGGRADARVRAAELFELVGLDPVRLDSYPHQLSGGMRQRAVIALSLCSDPDVIIADEPTTALDVVLKAQVLELLRDIGERLGLSIVMISHDLGAVADVCDDIAVMYAGQIMEHGPTAEVLATPAHPYTAALRAAYPSLHGPRQELVTIEGVPPALDDERLEAMCGFAARCSHAVEACAAQRPRMRELTAVPGRTVACDRDQAVQALVGGTEAAS